MFRFRHFVHFGARVYWTLNNRRDCLFTILCRLTLTNVRVGIERSVQALSTCWIARSFHSFCLTALNALGDILRDLSIHLRREMDWTLIKQTILFQSPASLLMALHQSPKCRTSPTTVHYMVTPSQKHIPTSSTSLTITTTCACDLIKMRCVDLTIKSSSNACNNSLTFPLSRSPLPLISTFVMLSPGEHVN